MREPRRQLQRTLFGGLAVFLVGMLAVSAYSLWRLRTEAIIGGLQMAALHARSQENFLTQSLDVAEQIAANLVGPELGTAQRARLTDAFNTTLHHTPFLRSLSLQDASGRIVLSSNPANVGITVATGQFLPLALPEQDTFRIGQAWIGRDFAQGRASAPERPVPSDAQSFFPATRSLRTDQGRWTVLMAFNTDFFVNQMAQAVDSSEGQVEVLLYDGTVLMGSARDITPGSLRTDELQGMQLNATESGAFEQTRGHGAASLTAFRASRLYPLVVVTHLDRAHALQAWQTDAQTLAAVLLPTLLGLVVLVMVLYRRQVDALEQRTEAERLLRINASVFEAGSEAIVVTDAQANILSVNRAFTLITGWTEAEVRGQNPRILAHGPRDPEVCTQLWDALLQSGTWRGEMTNQRKDGSPFIAWMSISAARDAQGRPQHFIGVMADITERKRSQEKLQLAASVFHNSREGITITDTSGTIVDVNEAFTEITGYSREEVVGQNPRILSSGRHNQQHYAAMWHSLIEKGHWYGEIWNRRKSGEVYAEMLTISTVRDAEGQPQHYVALFSDITSAKMHEAHLEHIAHFDALTNLPNRVLLADRLKQAMLQVQRRAQRLAVVYLDLDGFKVINDTHGHKAGDHLLIALAGRMKAALREGDTLARIGGDEFVAVLVDLTEATESMPMLNRLLQAANEPVEFEGRSLRVSASLGVTLYPQNEDVDADQLQRQADASMYQAKLAGKNCFHFF